MSSVSDSPPWRLEWNEDLSVCIPEIDAEHRHFIVLVNELNDAIIGRMAIEKIRTCMQAILDDAAAHFAHEERLFAAWGYPLAEQHAKKHAEITAALQDIMTGFEYGGVMFGWVEAGLKVKQALVEHLLTEDMKYRDFCFAQGMSCRSVTPGC